MTNSIASQSGSQGGLDFSLFIPPDPIATALHAGVVPGVASLVVLACLWLWKGDLAERGGWRWVVPLLFGALALWAEAAIRQWPTQWWPANVSGRFVHLAVGISIGGLAHALIRPRWLGFATGVVVVAAAIIGVILEPALRPSRDDFISALLHGGAVVAAMTAGVLLLDGAHDRSKDRGWILPLAALPAFGLAGPTLVLAGSAPAAQLSAILPAMLASAVLIAKLRGGGSQEFSLGLGGWTVVMAWHVGLILFNSYWGWKSLTPVSASLLALAPIGAAAVALPKVRDWPVLMRIAIGSAASGGPALAACVLAYRVAAASSGDAYDY